MPVGETVMRLLLAIAFCLPVESALADLYRWIEPETGSIKFSSYPPPWYGDPEQERRALKVEQIPAGKPPSARDLEPPSNPQSNGGVPAKPAASVPASATGAVEDRRRAMLKQLSARIATIIASKPEDSVRPYMEFGEQLREYQSLGNVLRQIDPNGEAARRKELEPLVAVLEARRRAMFQELSAVRGPALGSPPDEVERAWRDSQRKLASYSWIENALKLIDQAGEKARNAEAIALVEKLTSQWKPHYDLQQQRAIRER